MVLKDTLLKTAKDMHLSLHIRMFMMSMMFGLSWAVPTPIKVSLKTKFIIIVVK